MKLFERQGWNFLALGLLLWGVHRVITNYPDLLSGSLWGWPTSYWLVAGLAVPIAHQIFVWLCWRLELHYKVLTRFFGSFGFSLYRIGFMIFFMARILTVIVLSASNAESIELHDVVRFGTSAIIAVLFLYGAYSVFVFFGLSRAVGQDHFNPDASQIPLVRKGLFKYTRNGMYAVVFLVIYLPGLLYASGAGLLLGIFSHAFIWVHYYCTEKPDMRVIYGSGT
jgi:hypothetical protein